MGDVTRAFWSRWMLMAALAVIAFSSMLVFSPEFTQRFFDAILFYDGTSPVQGAAVEYIRFTYGVLGAVMIGWMAALIPIIRGPFRRGEPWGWMVIAISLGLWFLVDTMLSIVSGFWQNAVLNTVFIVLFAIPLAATRARLSP